MRTMLCFAAVVLLALAPTVAVAQPSDTLFAKMPFSFYAADRLMPEGSYRLTFISLTGSAGWLIADQRGKPGVLVVFHPGSVATGRLAKLTFRKYGDDLYFLAGLTHPARATNLSLPRSRRERELVTSRLQASVRPVLVEVLASVPAE